jgi:alkylhydroperoxidase family enzyme
VRWLLGFVERGLGKTLWAQRVLSHHPKSLLGAGLMEALVVHKDREVPRRVLKMVRVYVSARVSCPFCVDLNGKDFDKEGLSEADLEALLLYARDPEEKLPESFSPPEKAALELARAACDTPVGYTWELRQRVGQVWSPRAMVVISATAAQVNFWARLIQAFGTRPAGFSDVCLRDQKIKESR